ncbi:MAG: hypothetical protein RLZZ126_131 [Pseudomonadota bacterium]|jgi:uncharacterized protein
MDVLSPQTLVVVASFFAGLVDSIVGGGGLILVPALFAAFPGAPPATLLGMNKSASCWGTALAAWHYSRRVNLPWPMLWPAVLTALVGGWLGAYAVTLADPRLLRQLLPAVLVLLLVYTLAKKDLGHTHTPRHTEPRQRALAMLIGGGVGFYDGFFGPGAGSFLVFLLVRLLGYDFLHATAATKVINLGSNVAALALLAAKGHVWWHAVLWIAVANVLGSLVGTRLALKHGAGFVRVAFIGVVCALIVKTGYDAFLR